MPNNKKAKDAPAQQDPATQERDVERGPHDPILPDESQQTSTGGERLFDY